MSFVLGVAYFIHLRHVPGWFPHFESYFIQTALAAVGVIMGPVGLITLRSLLRSSVIVSACPVCGVEATRGFGDLKRESPWPIPCGQCTAYLHAQRKSSRVREVRFDEPSNGLTFYSLIKQQYVGIVPRRDDVEGRPFAFVMPAFCAICSNPKAPFTHESGFCGVTTDPKGEFRGLLYAYNYAGKTAPTTPDDLDVANRQIRRPACTAHKDKIAMERDSGWLQFCSYRSYREFCALNRILDGADAALKKASADTPTAVARVVPAKSDDGAGRSASWGG